MSFEPRLFRRILFGQGKFIQESVLIDSDKNNDVIIHAFFPYISYMNVVDSNYFFILI